MSCFVICLNKTYFVANLRSTSLGLIQDEGSKKKKKACNPLFRAMSGEETNYKRKIGKRQTSIHSQWSGEVTLINPQFSWLWQTSPDITTRGYDESNKYMVQRSWATSHLSCHEINLDKSTGNLHRMSPAKRKSFVTQIVWTQAKKNRESGCLARIYNTQWYAVMHSDTQWRCFSLYGFDLRRDPSADMDIDEDDLDPEGAPWLLMFSSGSTSWNPCWSLWGVGTGRYCPASSQLDAEGEGWQSWRSLECAWDIWVSRV